MKDIKIFYIKVDDENLGMDAIALVEQPAVEVNFLKFQKEGVPNYEAKFAKDEMQHLITGVVALADTPIYRWSPTMGEYYVVFTKDTIKKMVEKYSKDGLFNSINLQHDNGKKVSNVYLVESYLVNRERNIVPKEFEQVPDGSWICSFKVEDDALWDEIENGDALKGFSLQGFFDLEPAQKEEKEQTLDELIDDIIG